jgi:hypothetical protein
MSRHCPKCDKPMERIEGEPDVNVVGGWECSECEVFIAEWDVDDEEPDLR